MTKLLLLLLACPLGTQADRDEDLDPDGDGVYFPDDCDNIDPTIGTVRWYADVDADGFGDPGEVSTACEQPSGYVASDSDCDDGDPSIHPGAPEWCDGADGDCDGAVDESPEDPSTFYVDADADGYGLEAAPIEACEAPEGYSEVVGDCDDSAPSAYPGAEPICGDGLDNDCDGLGDCGLALEGTLDVGDAVAWINGDSDWPLHGAVVGGEDLTGDGVADVVVGSMRGSGEEAIAGAALLFAGPLSGAREVAQADRRLLGERTSDGAGGTLAVGDLDGDGLADLVVGAPDGYGDHQGVAYLAWGPIVRDLSLDSSSDIARLYGVDADDELATTLLSADFNADGALDLLIGAPGTNNERGAVSLVLGPVERRSQQVDRVEAGRYVSSASGVRLGDVVSAAGDVDGDGRTDLLFGAPDVLGGIAIVSTDLPSGELNVGSDFRASFRNHEQVDVTGFATTFTGAGDVDGDGHDDVLLAAPAEDQGSLADAGAAWLISGETLLQANAQVVDHQADAIATFIGDDDNLHLGASAHAPGDLTGDGRAELMIGAPGLEDSSGRVGGALLYEGPLSGALGPDDAAFRFVGVTRETDLGAALGDLGDLDGLGLPELTVFAPDAGDGVIYILPADGL